MDILELRVEQAFYPNALSKGYSVMRCSGCSEKRRCSLCSTYWQLLLTCVKNKAELRLQGDVRRAGPTCRNVLLRGEVVRLSPYQKVLLASVRSKEKKRRQLKFNASGGKYNMSDCILARGSSDMKLYQE
jgi:hypothetical protein